MLQRAVETVVSSCHGSCMAALNPRVDRGKDSMTCSEFNECWPRDNDMSWNALLKT